MKRNDLDFLIELINNDSRLCESELVRLENEPSALTNRLKQLRERVKDNEDLIEKLKASIFIAKPV